MSKILDIPYSTKLLKRTKYTESQTRLHINERAENVANAFKVKNPNKVKEKNILIVDDVCTTGATLQACGKVLRDACANSVYACSVATTDF